jgi:hypothetical protein
MEFARVPSSIMHSKWVTLHYLNTTLLSQKLSKIYYYIKGKGPTYRGLKPVQPLTWVCLTLHIIDFV